MTKLINITVKTQYLTVWAEEYNISISTLRARISKFHWSTKDALTIPVGARSEKND